MENKHHQWTSIKNDTNQGLLSTLPETNSLPIQIIPIFLFFIPSNWLVDFPWQFVTFSAPNYIISSSTSTSPQSSIRVSWTHVKQQKTLHPKINMGTWEYPLEKENPNIPKPIMKSGCILIFWGVVIQVLHQNSTSVQFFFSFCPRLLARLTLMILHLFDGFIVFTDEGRATSISCLHILIKTSPELLKHKGRNRTYISHCTVWFPNALLMFQFLFWDLLNSNERQSLL